jgi:nucleoside-diphosphate-sugar epimerase
MSETVVILGAGYTGKRVARRFLDRGAQVVVTTRTPAALQDLARFGATVNTLEAVDVPDGALLLHSIPARVTVPGRPARVVYLSTTGVYGTVRDVDENTPPAPDTDSAKLRLAIEHELLDGPWSTLILRPAAIYGPGRGIHVSMQEGRFQLAGDGENFVSRIHVDDLAAHAEAALLSCVTGAYPVGDDHPCTSREIAAYCAELLSLPMPPSVPRDSLHETRRADRRVNGQAIRNLLGVTLQYPTYREGLSH